MIICVMTRQDDVSPCDLIQETLAKMSFADWRIFVACCLMNQTVGLTMRPYLWKIFERWKTPDELANAEFEELRDLIRPLGLYNRRAKMLIEMSRHYVEDDWNDPRELPGCGKYAYDSWLIFCKRCDVAVVDVDDKELRRYLHWSKTGEFIPQGSENIIDDIYGPPPSKSRKTSKKCVHARASRVPRERPEREKYVTHVDALGTLT